MCVLEEEKVCFYVSLMRGCVLKKLGKKRDKTGIYTVK